jgi:hypothetical protein
MWLTGVAAAAILLVSGDPALGATRCVGRTSGCFATIQRALDAAGDGDAILVGPGTFAGPIAITKSVSLAGAGAGRTVIRGGGPVVTVGTAAAAAEPTVSIAGVTVTGGLTRSTPALIGGANLALGGGVFVPPAAGGADGATLTIRDSAVSGNRTAPSATVPSGGAVCPGGPCPFAGSGGAGIDSWGALTVTGSVISDNEAGGALASDAEGGGIESHRGGVTIAASRIVRNHATASAPNGRFGQGGGIFIAHGPLSIRGSHVDANTARLTGTLPVSAGGQTIELAADGGGVHAGDGTPVMVEGSSISANTATAVDPLGEPLAYDSGMLVLDGPLTMSDTVVSGNSAAATYATSTDVGPGGSALELDAGGTISDSRITGNPSVAISPGGAAAVNGALAILNFNGNPQLVSVRDSVISSNSATASSRTGTATTQGGGVFNDSLLELRNVVVAGNREVARGPSGAAQGGGVWNGAELNDPPVELTLSHSAITGNTLAGDPGIALQGGGVFSTLPFTRAQTLIAGNVPDQCVGCSDASAAHGPAGLRGTIRKPSGWGP